MPKTEAKKNKSISELDLTQGNFFWKMPLFALPMAATTVLQLLYTTVDLWTVANFGGGANSMSAVGSNTALINLIVTVFLQLSMGANVCISNAKGAKDPERADKILHTSIWVALIGGIIVMVFGYFMSRTMLEWMDTPSSIIDNATAYLKIYFIGMPLSMIYNYGSQILRALGDSRRPFFILIISGLINVVFDIVLVRYFNMDVSGVAWATVLSELVSAVLTMLWLGINKKGFVRFQFSHFRIDKMALKQIMIIGVPAAVQGLAFCIPNVLIQSNLYTITDYRINGVPINMDEIVAGSSASSQIENFVYAFIEAFASGVVSFVGQNYGAKNVKNIRKSYWIGMIWMVIFWGLCSLIIGLLPYRLLGIFITESEGLSIKNALAAGKERMFLMCFTYVLDGVMDTDGNYLRGMRHSTTPSVITLIGCTGSRILFLYTLFRLPYFHTIFWLYATFPISWTIVDIVYIPFIIRTEKKEFSVLQA